MTVELHRDDLPPGRTFGNAVAIDTETLGLNPYRDRLCLVQLSRGDGKAELVQLRRRYEAPELKRLLADQSVLKIFHFARFDMAVLKHSLGVMPGRSIAPRSPRALPAPSPTATASRISPRSCSASSSPSSSNPPIGGLTS